MTQSLRPPIIPRTSGVEIGREDKLDELQLSRPMIQASLHTRILRCNAEARRTGSNCRTVLDTAPRVAVRMDARESGVSITDVDRYQTNCTR